MDENNLNDLIREILKKKTSKRVRQLDLLDDATIIYKLKCGPWITNNERDLNGGTQK